MRPPKEASLVVIQIKQITHMCILVLTTVNIIGVVCQELQKKRVTTTDKRFGFVTKEGMQALFGNQSHDEPQQKRQYSRMLCLGFVYICNTHSIYIYIYKFIADVQARRPGGTMTHGQSFG